MTDEDVQGAQWDHVAGVSPTPVSGHEGGTVVELCLIAIVHGAGQNEVALAVITALAERYDVVKLESVARGTTSSLAVAERALATVAGPYGAPDRARNPPRRRGRIDFARLLARGRRGGESGPLEIAEENGHRAIDDRGQIAVGDLMAQKGLGAGDLVVELPVGGELDLVSRRPDRSHDRRRSRGLGGM